MFCFVLFCLTAEQVGALQRALHMLGFANTAEEMGAWFVREQVRKHKAKQAAAAGTSGAAGGADNGTWNMERAKSELQCCK